MPIKRKNAKMMKIVPSDVMGTMKTMSVNLTTSDKSEYDLICSQFLPLFDAKTSENLTTTATYGSGNLAYEGKSDSKDSIFVGESKNGKQYMVRATAAESIRQLNEVVRELSPSLCKTKISLSESVMGIPITDDINVAECLSESLKAQQNRKSRVSVSTSALGYFVIGSPSSATNIQIGLSKDSKESGKPCLCVVSKVKETKPKFIGLMKSQNMDLSDIHSLCLRESTKTLNYCALKELLEMFVKQTFDLPSQKSLKEMNRSESTKIRYFRGAFKSAVSYTSIIIGSKNQQAMDDFTDLLEKSLVSLTEAYKSLGGKNIPSGAGEKRSNDGGGTGK